MRGDGRVGVGKEVKRMRARGVGVGEGVRPVNTCERA